MPRSIQAAAVRYGGCPVRSQGVHAKDPFDGSPAVRVRIVDLSKEHFAELRTVHHRFLLRIIDFQRRNRTDHLVSYAKALKEAQCEGVQTTIRKWRLLFAGAVQWANNERLTRPVMFGTMAGGENPRPGRPEKNWAKCLVDDLRVFRATEGSTQSVPLEFGVETVLWCTAAKKGGKWYR